MQWYTISKADTKLKPIQRPKRPPVLATNPIMGIFWSRLIRVTTGSWNKIEKVWKERLLLLTFSLVYVSNIPIFCIHSDKILQLENDQIGFLCFPSYRQSIGRSLIFGAPLALALTLHFSERRSRSRSQFFFRAPLALALALLRAALRARAHF